MQIKVNYIESNDKVFVDAFEMAKANAEKLWGAK